jgi:transposase
VYSSAGKCSPGHLSRQGSPELRWAAFEAAKCAARPGNGKDPTLAVERKLLRRCYHTCVNSAMPR